MSSKLESVPLEVSEFLDSAISFRLNHSVIRADTADGISKSKELFLRILNVYTTLKGILFNKYNQNLVKNIFLLIEMMREKKSSSTYQ